MGKDLDVIEEKGEGALLKLTSYHQQPSRLYNIKVHPRMFALGDLVLRRVLAGAKNPANENLGTKWKGPYKVASQVDVEVDHLEPIEDKR